MTVQDAAGARQRWRWEDVVAAVPGDPEDLNRWYDATLPFEVPAGPARVTLDLHMGMEAPRPPCLLDLHLSAGAETVVTALFSPDATSGACALVGPGAYPAESWALDVAAADPRLEAWLAEEAHRGTYRVAWVHQDDVVVRYDLAAPVAPNDYPLDRCSVGRADGAMVTGVQWLIDRSDRSIAAVAPGVLHGAHLLTAPGRATGPDGRVSTPPWGAPGGGGRGPVRRRAVNLVRAGRQQP